MIYRNIYFKILLIILATVGIIRIAIILPSRSNQNDFAHYYISSKLLLQGENPYINYLAPQYEAYGFVFEERIHHASNPPTLIWLFSPLARLTPGRAFLCWAIIQVISLIAILVFLRKLLNNRISNEAWWVICALIIIYSPVYYNFYYSQVQLLLLTFVLGAYLLQKSGRHHFSLFTITMTGMIKLFPLVLVPWFIWRADKKIWRRGLYALEALLICCVIFFLTGPKLWVDFLQYGTKVINENIVNWSFNYSLPSFIINTAYASHDFHVSKDLGTLWMAISTATGLAIIILSYVITFLNRSDLDIEFSILLISMIAGSITAWGHYLVFLIFPLTIWFVEISHKGDNGRNFFYGIILFSMIQVGVGNLLYFNSILFNSLINYIPLYAMLILLTLLIRELMINRSLQKYIG